MTDVLRPIWPEEKVSGDPYVLPQSCNHARAADCPNHLYVTVAPGCSSSPSTIPGLQPYFSSFEPRWWARMSGGLAPNEVLQPCVEARASFPERGVCLFLAALAQ